MRTHDCAGSQRTLRRKSRCLRTSPREACSPERRRLAVDGIKGRYGLSERHACRIVGQARKAAHKMVARMDFRYRPRALLSCCGSCPGNFGLGMLKVNSISPSTTL